MPSIFQRKLLQFLEKTPTLRTIFTRQNLCQRQIPRERPAVKSRGAGSRSGIPLLIIPITTFGLGTWQIRRREWKLNLIKSLEEKMTAPPTPLPYELDEVRSMEYRRVTVTGTFDHSRELYVGPRSEVHDNSMGSNRAANLGVNVITPFKLADRDETILINRGHVSFKRRPPQLRQDGQVEGEVTLTGVVRVSDRNPIFEGDPAKDGYWLYTNVEELADVTEATPILLDADIKSTVPGGPTGGQTRVNLRNEHMTYILTWYSLFIFSSIMWYRYYRSPVATRVVLDHIKRNHHKM